MFIDPSRSVRWRVVRTYPGLVCPAFPNLLFDYLEIRRGRWRPGTCIPDDCIWHDGYVSGQIYEHHATIFDSYEYAEMVALVMEHRWPGTKFMIEPYQR